MGLTFGSLFAGIGGFDLGFHQVGLRCAWQVEIDGAARGVLARHWPDVPRYEDVRAVGAASLAPVDVICGGFPCQDLSVAGKRSGLAGARSGLFYEMTRITDELRPALLVWENVPGLLSSDSGRDFGRVLVELERIGYSGCWTTLDAQFFGVAQRRQRVFGVFARRDIGAERCAEILSLAARLPWNTQTGRATRAGVAAAIAASAGHHGRSSPRGDGSDNLVSAFAWHRTNADVSDGVSPSLTVSDGHVPAITFNMHSYGQDASAASVSPTLAADHGVGVTVIKGAANGRAPENGPQYGEVLDDGTCYTLNCTEVHAVSIAENQRGELRTADIAAQLTNGGGKPGQGYPAVLFQEAQYGIAEYDSAGSLRAGRIPEHQMTVNSMGVRRLTPLECERLQGFPDGWTADQADSTRYRQLGNAVAVPCARWIGRRILEAL